MRFTAARLALLVLPALGPTVAASTPDVPGSYPTIQAIDAAVDGDVVLVATGSYHEHLNFEGKAITVRSSVDFNAIPNGVRIRGRCPVPGRSHPTSSRARDAAENGTEAGPPGESRCRARVAS